MPSPKAPERTRSARELLRALRPYTRPQRRYVGLILAILLAGLPLAWATPFLVQRVFDDAVANRDLGELWRLALGLGLLTFAAALLSLARGACTTLFQNKTIHRLRLHLFRVNQSLGLSFTQGRETGETMSRLSDDAANLGGVMADTFASAVTATVQLLVVAAILVVREWRLALAAVAGAAGLLGIQALFVKPLRRRSTDVRERAAELNAGLHQALSGHQLVRATASEGFEAHRFGDLLARSVRTTVGRDFFGLWTGHPTVVLGGLFPLMLLVLAGYLMAKGELTQGQLFAFFILLGQLFDAAATLGRLNPAFQTSLASLDRIVDLLEARKLHRQPTGTHVLTRIDGRVRFESVSFRYRPAPDGELVLRDISLDVAAGTTVALVGRSGAGKTTLLSLIPRFFEPTSGEIFVDDVPLREIEVRSLRARMGLVPQDVFLFDRTIAENIRYGSPAATPADVRAAAEAACCLDFVEALPKGFETRVGERGVTLSGGQRQRLAIAREILRDPRIIILDEATSSLDSQTERAVHTALRRLLEGRTAFLIAHRLSTVRDADLILVIDEGQIVARGTYTELLATSPEFRRLALLQDLSAPERATGPWTPAS